MHTPTPIQIKEKRELLYTRLEEMKKSDFSNEEIIAWINEKRPQLERFFNQQEIESIIQERQTIDEPPKEDAMISVNEINIFLNKLFDDLLKVSDVSQSRAYELGSSEYWHSMYVDACFKINATIHAILYCETDPMGKRKRLMEQDDYIRKLEAH